MRFLDLFFQQLAGDPRLRSFCALEGFVAAMTLGPKSEPVDEWYPNLFGPSGNIQWESPAQEEMFRAMVDSTVSMVAGKAGSLTRKLFHPYPCRPDPRHLAGEQNQLHGMGQWCQGFAKAVDMNEPAWARSELQGHMANLLEFADNPANRSYPPDNVHETGRWLESEVTEVFRFWRRNGNSGPAARPPVRPAARAETGRNDPCPCGSGRKYKKCCLHSAV